MTVTFARKVAGVHTAKLTDDRELVLSSGGASGWCLVVRDAQTRKIVKRLTSGMSTLTEGKRVADTLVNSPKFGAFLLSIA